MKKAIILITLNLISLIILSQQNISVNRNSDSFEQEVSMFKNSAYTSDKSENINYINGTLWVTDSIYRYKSNIDNEWDLEKREVMYEKNDSGRIIGSTIDKFQNFQWNKYYIGRFTYFDNTLYKSHLWRSWNSEIKEWSDTSFYKSINKLNTIDTFYLKSWNFNANHFDNSHLIIRTTYNNNTIEYEFGKTWDSVSNTLQNAYLSDFEFDSIKMGFKYYTKLWNIEDNKWVIQSEIISRYDPITTTTTRIRKTLNKTTNELDNYELSETTFSNDKLKKTKIKKKWDKNKSIWKNSSKVTTIHNSQGHIIEVDYYKWKSQGWVYYIRSLIEFNSKELITRSVHQNWSSYKNSWLNNEQIIFVYDNRENEILELEQKWDKTINKWQNVIQTIDSFSTKNIRVKSLKQEWNIELGKWDNIKRYNINSENNKTNSLYETWDKSERHWTNSRLFTKEYDEFGNYVFKKSFKWNDSIERWDKIGMSQFFWSEFKPLKLQETNNISFDIFPNPSSNKILIKSKSLLFGDKILIYSLDGKLISNLIYNNESIDISNLTSGIYFLKAIINKQFAIRKFVVNKNQQ